MSNYIYVKSGETEEENNLIKLFFQQHGVLYTNYNFSMGEAYYFINIDAEKRDIHTIGASHPLFPLLKEYGTFYTMNQIREEVDVYNIGDEVHLLMYNGYLQYRKGIITNIFKITSNSNVKYGLTIKSECCLIEVDVQNLQKKAYNDEVNKIFIAPNVSMLQYHTKAFRSSIQATLEEIQRL